LKQWWKYILSNFSDMDNVSDNILNLGDYEQQKSSISSCNSCFGYSFKNIQSPRNHIRLWTYLATYQDLKKKNENCAFASDMIIFGLQKFGVFWLIFFESW